LECSIKKNKAERTTAVAVAQLPFYQNNLQKHKNPTSLKVILRGFFFLVEVQY
jgi:hypothetical protein